MKKSTSLVYCVGIIAFGLLAAVVFAVNTGSDTDADGMTDGYELFFGLNHTNAADAALDPDGDSVTNLQESILWTDPLAPDTDRDGFLDDADDNPLSRAVFLWSDPRFAAGDSYLYPGPVWWSHAFKIDSSWTTNGWEAGGCCGDTMGSLNIQVARDLLTSDVVLDLDLFDSENGSLYAALCDTNQSVIVSDLYGNLIEGTGQRVARSVSVPFAAYPDAAIVSLWRGTGDVLVYGGLMYIDADGDGLDADQELQMGTSDLDSDSDDDGVSDRTECLETQTNPMDPDSDDDGLLDGVDPTFDPISSTLDSDGDGLTDDFELRGCRYTLMTNELTWADAKMAAEAAGGHLVTIASQQEQNEMLSLLGKRWIQNAWIGLSNNNDEGVWSWVTGEPMNFTLWGEGAPDIEHKEKHGVAYKKQNGPAGSKVWAWANVWNTAGRAYLIERETMLDPFNPDMDGDGLSDGLEMSLGTNPASVDSDHDGLSDREEYQETKTNPRNADSDDDGLPDPVEILRGTNPLNPDSDGDGLVDGRESRFWLVPFARSWPDAKSNAERRGGHLATVISEAEHNELMRALGSKIERKKAWIGATDEAEEGQWTWITGEPFNYAHWHSEEGALQPDNDGGDEDYAFYGNSAGDWFDGSGQHLYVIEYSWSLDPLNPDSDGDGLSDGQEIRTYGANPFMADSDGDGANDGAEVAAGTRVYQEDTDKDGLSDGVEISGPTDPKKADSDGDGLLDGEECRYVMVDRFVTWAEAKSDAELRGGHLAMLEEVGEYADLIRRFGDKLVHGSGPWLGATQSEGRWTWLSGEPLPSTDWQATIRLERWLTGENCLYFGKHSGWYAEPADALHRYIVEFDQELDPLNPDTDGDGLSDYDEISVHATNPFSSDTDADGLSDAAELAAGMNPCSSDSDRDGLTESQETVLGLDPLNSDADGDGLLDGEEISITLTDPWLTDSNTNGVADLETVTTIRGVDTLARFAEHYSVLWEESEEGALTQSRLYQHTEMTYELNIAEAGIYRIAFQTTFEPEDGEAPLRDTYEPRLKLSVDELSLGRLSANTGPTLPEYTSFTPWLSVGTHKVICSVGGPCPQGRFTIESVELSMVDGEDLDGNGVPDWMERQLALLSDTDGDGLSDFDEVMLYGSDPLNEDCDQDGVSDGAEVTAGTDLHDADSDDDGVSDGAEVNELQTNPLVAEFDGTSTPVDHVTGSAAVNMAGEWTAEGTELVSEDRRGWVEYAFDFPEQDLYCLTINAAHLWTKNSCTPAIPVDTSCLQISVDGTYVGSYPLVSANGVYVDVRAFLPVLPAGDHTVRLFWENTSGQLAIKVRDLGLQSLGGPDANGNGTKDWVEVSVASMAGLDAVSESFVSPACIEGAARYVPLMSLVDEAGQIVPAGQSAGPRWYANIPLKPGTETDARISFQNGALDLPVNIRWVPYNLLDHNGATLVIRKGDALRLTCIDPSRAFEDREHARGGQFELRLLNQLFSSPNTRPVAVTFDEAGTFNVNGTYRRGTRTIFASINVKVVGGSFPEESPACLVGSEREWSFEGMPASVVYEVDESVELTVLPQTTNSSLQTVCLKANQTNRDHVLLARLCDGGPIVDSMKLEPFWVQNASDGYFWVVERFEDSELWEVNSIVKNLPDTVEMEIKVFVAGVTLDDYTLERWVTAADYDETGAEANAQIISEGNRTTSGSYNFRLFHPNSVSSSVCHTFKVYQDGVFLGEAFSGRLNDIGEE